MSVVLWDLSCPTLTALVRRFDFSKRGENNSAHRSIAAMCPVKGLSALDAQRLRRQALQYVITLAGEPLELLAIANFNSPATVIDDS